jgi:NAD(P)-dependent dehydrogenase (short-subunit alcohol dehydrogenase family)
MDIRLNGRSAVITGGSRGLGLAMASDAASYVTGYAINVDGGRSPVV